MTLNVFIDLDYEFEVNANASEVFGVLADVPTSASFFPKIDKLVDLGGGSYRWEMEKIGMGQVSIQIIYTSNYVADPAMGTVVWTSVKGEGNALVSGSWKITGKKNSTVVVLKTKGDLTLPLPGLMKMMVEPIVRAEFEKMTELYIDNLTQRFSGEV